MKPKDITKAILEKVATELNKVMELKPVIATGREIKMDSLREDIIEAAGDPKEGLKSIDKITAQTREVLTLLGVDVPSPPNKKTEKSKKVTGKPKANKTAKRCTRFTSLADAFFELNLNIALPSKVLAAKADEIFVKNGGKSNLKEAGFKSTQFLAIANRLLTFGVKIK